MTTKDSTPDPKETKAPEKKTGKGVEDDSARGEFVGKPAPPEPGPDWGAAEPAETQG